MLSVVVCARCSTFVTFMRFHSFLKLCKILSSVCITVNLSVILLLLLSCFPSFCFSRSFNKRLCAKNVCIFGIVSLKLPDQRIWAFLWLFVEFANSFSKGLYQFTLKPAKLSSVCFTLPFSGWIFVVWLQKSHYTYSFWKQVTSTKWP